MGYYKDTGSLQSMASAEAILKKRMPEKDGILPVAELLFVAESMWVGEHDMKGHFHPSFRFVKAKRYNAKPHVLIELDGETLADINGRSKLEEAWLDGVLPMPKYVIALYDAPKELGELKVSIEKVREKKKYSKFVKKYEELRRSLQDADGIDRIIAKYLKKRDSKVIVFCPNQKKLQEFMLLRREWFGRVNKEVHAYKTTSADPYGSRDFQEFKEDSSSALKVLYCINQLNEAVHVKGIDAIVMVRPTKSPVIFQQQLGRALTSGGNRTPLVFDLCNNFGSLGGIAGMQERMERAYEKKSEQGEKPIYEPKDFHVIDEIKDPRELAEELREALNPSTTIDEKISFLEEIAAQNGGQL